MNAEQRKKRIADMFKAVSDGDAEPLMNALDEQVRWTIIGSTRFSGTFNGKAEVGERLLAPLGALLDGHLHITPENIMADGDFVIVQGHGESRTAAGGTYNNTYCWVYRWRGDKIIELTEYLDTEIVTAAFGR
jgi:ketosteroid isomerase-like protein